MLSHRREMGRAQSFSVLVNAEIWVLTEKLANLSHVGIPWRVRIAFLILVLMKRTICLVL